MRCNNIYYYLCSIIAFSQIQIIIDYINYFIDFIQILFETKICNPVARKGEVITNYNISLYLYEFIIILQDAPNLDIFINRINSAHTIVYKIANEYMILKFLFIYKWIITRYMNLLSNEIYELNNIQPNYIEFFTKSIQNIDMTVPPGRNINYKLPYDYVDTQNLTNYKQNFINNMITYIHLNNLFYKSNFQSFVKSFNIIHSNICRKYDINNININQSNV